MFTYLFISIKNFINKISVCKIKPTFNLKFNFKLNKNDNNFIKQKKEYDKNFHLSSADIISKSKKGLISVILPVYNCEKYLEKAIISVLSQTYVNLELIIVDDGSDDNSKAIADNFLYDERVRVIHQKNLTLPVALNNGFNSAQGEFYTWTSADNIMLPNFLETLATELQRDRECDMVYGNMRLIDENDNILRGYGWYELPPLSGNVILPSGVSQLNTVANNTMGAAFLYRSGVCKSLFGYSENLFTLEDYDYFMRINSFFKIKHTLHKRPIYEYRIHKESLTSKDKELHITEDRPCLMEFDRLRRNFYKLPLYIYIDGKNQKIEAALSKTSHLIRCEKTAKKIISALKNDIVKAEYKNSDKPPLEINNSKRFIYLNIGNIPKTIDLTDIIEDNDKILTVVVTENSICEDEFYKKKIIQNSVNLPTDNNTVCIKSPSAIASYIAITVKDYATVNNKQ